MYCSKSYKQEEFNIQCNRKEFFRLIDMLKSSFDPMAIEFIKASEVAIRQDLTE